MAWIARLFVLPFAAALLALTTSAQAEFPVRGGAGGGVFRSECGRGTYLTGLYGRTGEWVDQIGILCAPYDFSANRFVGGNAIQPPHGGQTGGAQTSICPPGQAVTAFKLYIHPNPEFHKHNSPNYHAIPQYVRGVLATCGVPAAPSAGSFCFGKCSDADTGTFLGSDLPKMRTYSQNCAAEGMMMTGINGRGGSYVDAVGGFCGQNPTPPVAQAPPPPPPPPPAPAKPIKTTGKAKGAPSGPSAPPGLLVCRFGPTMKPIGNPSPDAMVLTFDAAPQGADTELPGQGQCAWDVTPVSPAQAKRIGLGKANIAALAGIQPGTIFKVHATAMTAFLMSRSDLQVVADNGPVPMGAGEPAEGGGVGEPAQGGDGGGMAGGGMAGGGMGMPSAGCPAGDATVQTPAGLDFLNVRSGPSSGAAVVAQVPNGSTVTVSGSCINAAKGAGFAKQTLAPKPGGGDAGGGGAPAAGGGSWCRIEAPDQGCVSAQFLVFAGNGGGAAGVPLDPAKGAGFAMTKPKGQGPGQGQGGGNGFGGHWSANADGVAYDLRLTQVGSVVKGSFTASDGSKGTILGNLNGKTLRFAWVQTNDGQTGSGKFVLSGNGGSFSGTYNFQVGNFDKVEGQWNGQRM